MENENMNFEEQFSSDAEEAPAKVSPFADSIYESAYEVQPEKVHPVKAKTKKQANVGKRITAVLLVLAILALGCGATAVGVSAYWNNKMELFSKVVDNKLAALQSQTGTSSAPSGESAAPIVKGTPGEVYERNVQAVVAISNQSLTTNLFGQVSETASSGSGFIVSEDGYVVTNYHVIKDATTLKVITWDSVEHNATLVGGDSSNDFAVLKIEGEGFPCVQLGDSDKLIVGDQVAAIGNPLGELTSTLTVGYVSATDRAVNTDGTYINMLQTDAAINSGNSGGPLFNMAGEVIGITTAKYSGTSNSGATIEGVGFAIPINDVAGMVEDLIELGYISGAYLGVMVQDVNAEVAEMYGFPLGAYVVEVTEGTCAARAGLQAKDIIINLGGHDVSSMSQLTRVLRQMEPGEQTTISVYRGGQEIHMEITLDEKPRETQQPQQEQQTVAPESSGAYGDWSSMFPFFGFGG